MKRFHKQFVPVFTGNFRFWSIYSIKKSWKCYTIWLDNHYKDKYFGFKAETSPIFNMIYVFKIYFTSIHICQNLKCKPIQNFPQLVH